MKQLTSWAAIALTTVALSAASCSSGDDAPQPVICPVEPIVPVPPTTTALTRSEEQMVSASNGFTFNLMRRVQHPDSSQVLSPLSITFALGMLNNGAAGETQQQINDVLGFTAVINSTLPGDAPASSTLADPVAGAVAINDFCYKMATLAPTVDPQTTVTIANNIYLNNRYELYQAFTANAKAFYGAEPEARNFSDGQTRDVINQWAADHTQQMIKEVLTEQEFNPDAVSYLLNAIYFKGQWTHQFDKQLTVDRVFEHAGDTKELVTLPMMHQTDMLSYAEDDNYQAVQLPYGAAVSDGEQTSQGGYAMTILLPKVQQGQARNAVPPVPTAEEFGKLCRQLSPREVDLLLPRFETDTNVDLVPVMKALGMPKAFTTEAEFPNFCTLPTYIGKMKQVAKIKVDEEGSEAAAVTVVGMETAIGPEPPVVATFHATRPFLYVISERKTGAVFFIGQFTGH